MSKQTEELKLALNKAFQLGKRYWSWADSEYSSHWKKADAAKAEFDQLVQDTINAALAEQPAQQEPVAWTDHVEQRLLTWRQSFVNKSGDQLALDDFMDKRSLDDLIDFVCDEYTRPQAREPLTNEQIGQAAREAHIAFCLNKHQTYEHALTRVIEAAHGIKVDA